MRNASKTIFWPALALAVSAFALPAQAQSTRSTNETQRGVPGVDVDVNTTGRSNDRGVPGVNVDVNRTNQSDRGAPGVDVDVGKNASDRGVPGVEVNTRASGAGADGMAANQRTARADRN